MARESKIVLEDILGAILKIHRYTTGQTFDTFSADEKTVDAVVRNLELIGDAVAQIPRSVRRAQKDVAWDGIIEFHEAIERGRFAVDHEIVWDMIHSRLPSLENAIQRMTAG